VGEQPLSELAYEDIVGRIIRKDLLPGDVVDRRQLADELGVSLSPVVQAVGRLELEGFLEVLPRRGTRVRVIRPEDFRAQMLVRNALECQAARIYCGATVRENEDRLLSLARRVDESREGRRINWEAEIAFHRALVALVGSPGFLSEYDRVMRVGHFILVSTFSERDPFPIDPSHTWHSDLVIGLETDDPDEAERILREHLEAGRSGYLRGAASV
jgi:DNA-binding GntR family transcriptional regulator